MIRLPIPTGRTSRLSGSTRSSQIWRDAAAVAVIAVVVGTLYSPILFGHASLMTDTLRPSGPMFVGDPDAGGPITFMKEIAVAGAWGHLHLPLWFAHEGYGITLAGNQAAPWFFPEVIFHLLLSGNYSDWNVVALFIGGIGTYILASRDLAMSKIAATVSALAFTLSGPFIANINLDMINPLLIMPFLLLASKRLVETDFALSNIRWWTWLAATSFLVSQLFLAGFDEVIPLELFAIGLYVLVLMTTLGKGAARIALRAASFAVALAIGFLASAIATTSLQSPLKNYQLFQNPIAWSAHNSKSWMFTLIDPWSFGKSLTGGALQGTNTVWAPGNPIIFFLALAALVAMVFFQKPKGWLLWWRVVSAALVAYGILAFANIFHVLNIMDISPLNLIISSRFMSFLWWLPLALLAGAGTDAIAIGARRIAGISTLGILGAIVAFALYVRHEGPKKFPMLNAQFFHKEITQNGEIFGLFALFVIIVLVARPKFRRGVVLLGMIAMISLVLPRNFYSNYQAPQAVKPIQAALERTGLAGSLTYSPVSLYLPSGILSRNLSSIQAFDVFFPKGYAQTVEHYFGSQPAGLPSSPLYPAAPAMFNLRLTASAVGALDQMGVGAMILPYHLSCTTATNYLPGAEPSSMTIPATRYSRAIKTLIKVYLSRSDVMTAYPICGVQGKRTNEISLLRWAQSVLEVHDSSALTLAPYLSNYSSLAVTMTTDPKFWAIQTSVSKQALTDVQLAATATYAGTKEYVYALNRAKNATLLWVPSSIKTDLASNQIIPFTSQVANLSQAKGLSSAQQTTLTARLMSLDSNSQTLSMTLKTNHAGLVALRQQIVPGATLSVNGKPSKLFAIDGFLDAMHVPAGISKVVINYASNSTLALFWVDLAMNLALLVAFLAGTIIIWQKKPGPTPPRHRITGLRT